MTHKSRIGLGREIVLTLAAVIKLSLVIYEFVTKVVSYARRHTQLSALLPSQR